MDEKYCENCEELIDGDCSCEVFTYCDAFIDDCVCKHCDNCGETIDYSCSCDYCGDYEGNIDLDECHCEEEN